MLARGKRCKEKKKICLLLKNNPRVVFVLLSRSQGVLSAEKRRFDPVDITYNKSSMPMKNTFFSRFRANANANAAGNFFFVFSKRRAHAEV